MYRVIDLLFKLRKLFRIDFFEETPIISFATYLNKQRSSYGFSALHISGIRGG